MTTNTKWALNTPFVSQLLSLDKTTKYPPLKSQIYPVTYCFYCKPKKRVTLFPKLTLAPLLVLSTFVINLHTFLYHLFTSLYWIISINIQTHLASSDFKETGPSCLHNSQPVLHFAAALHNERWNFSFINSYLPIISLASSTTSLRLVHSGHLWLHVAKPKGHVPILTLMALLTTLDELTLFLLKTLFISWFDAMRRISVCFIITIF